VDYYATLGIDPTADTKTIRTAYRKLAFEYHPDRRADDPEAADKMKQLNEAYAVLSDETKRRNYDAMKFRYGDTAYDQFRGSYTEQDIFSGSDIRSIFEELAKDFNLRGFDALFSEVYGPGFKRFEFKKNGFSAQGFFFSGPLFRRKPADGSPRTGRSLFQTLADTVRSIGAPRPGRDRHDRIVLTVDHAAQGGPYAYLIKESGTKILVKVPKGIRHGQTIRLAGMGKAGVHGGTPGNLYLRVSIRRTPVQVLKQLMQSLTALFRKT
jgi:curved DNA-binding protein